VKLKVPFVSEFLAKLMLTVAVADPEALSVTELEEMEHFELAGPPLHASDTAPVKPSTGVRVSVNVAVFAIEIVAEAGFAPIVKSVPVPLRLTL
jgi:hypothetical protein